MRWRAWAGHRVQRAGNGREAFIAASNNTPDIIVSDVVMPVMDGIRLVHALREAPMLVHIPVILTTGVNVPEGLPVQALLRKPFVAAHLLSLIYRLVDKRSRPESFGGDVGHSGAVGGDERKS
ncbi:Regulator of RpoS [Paraburkholderia ultramafica]|uniref:Regulator of RpoS n=1 Tax=Paraburkholderia ultramafica TaxID=1544867 RepID=A0A6S7BCK8_9BURK|nr:Regulator of RpoS [Paraburkholderia ultramafica]